MENMRTSRPETSGPTSPPKFLLAFVAGLLLSAGGFWLATRPSATASHDADQSSQRTAQATSPVKPAEPQPPTSASGDADSTTLPSKAATAPSLRPSAAGHQPHASTGSSAGNQRPALKVAEARDLPDLKPTEIPPSYPQPSSSPPLTNGPVDVQPNANPEPVFRPADQPEPVQHQPRTVTIEAGTSLVVRLAEALSTDRNATGDAFRATLDAPIILEGFIIADKGSRVRGRVADSRKAGRVDGVSSIALTVTEINTTDGQTVPIRTSNWEKQGAKSVGTDAAKIGAGAALGAIIGALAGGGKGAAIGAASGGAAGTGVVLATRGKPTVLPVESVISFRVDSPVSITEQMNK